MNSEDRDFSGSLTDSDIDTIAQTVFRISDERDLSWDMEAQQNADGRFEICLTDENGNGEEYWSFDTEEMAEKVIDRLGEMIEKIEKLDKR